MEQIAFFDTKPYDRTWFDQLNQSASATLNTNSLPTAFLLHRDAVL